MSTSAIGMSQALAARDAGMASSAEHAEQDAPGWGERAYQAIGGMRGFVVAEFTMEQARDWCYALRLDRPAEERAWGSVTQRLIRDRIIEPVGFARAASSNSAFKPTYRLVRAV